MNIEQQDKKPQNYLHVNQKFQHNEQKQEGASLNDVLPTIRLHYDTELIEHIVSE